MKLNNSCNPQNFDDEVKVFIMRENDSGKGVSDKDVKNKFNLPSISNAKNIVRGLRGKKYVELREGLYYLTVEGRNSIPRIC